MQAIRKISIGTDYKNSMHYVVGQEVIGSYKIHSIIQVEDNSVVIWIEKDMEVVCWKSINKSYPMIIEYNINF
jgi:hypothetical protein